MSEDYLGSIQEDELEKPYDWVLMKRLLKFTRNYWKQFSIASIMLVLSTIADIPRPYLMKFAIDDVLTNDKTVTSTRALDGFIGSNSSPYFYLQVLGLLFIFSVILGFVFNFLQIFILSRTGQTIIYNIRQQVFSHLCKLPISYFDKNPVGRLVTRVTNDTETLNEMYVNVLVSLLKDISIFVVSLIFMFMLDVKLTLIVCGALPFVLFATILFRSKARVIYRNVRTTLARINASISENISGIKIIQLFGREKQSYEEFEKVSGDYLKAGIKEIIVFGTFRPAIEMMAALVIAVLIWFGGGEVVRNNLQFGVLFAMINFVTQFFQPINDLSEKFNILQSAMAASERIFVILDTPVEDKNNDNLKADVNFTKACEIEIKNVWFAYKNEEYVLKDVSFKVPAGKTVAIVGATGSGKTTITNLVNRFYDKQKGMILIDGAEIETIPRNQLRKKIALVPQDVFLFSGTVRENISLFDNPVTEQQIEDYSKHLNVHGFVSELSNGYNQELGERGASLSVGQRQLLAFARAMAFDPSILILDEATANIDTETEMLIQDALTKLSTERTTIVVAHRLSTIQHADKIIVLHKGRVKEEGTHQELLAKEGLYYNLYKLQAS